MDKKHAYEMGRRVGLVKFAAFLRKRDPKLVKLARTLTALERKGKITKIAADRAFDKTAGIMLPAMAAYAGYKAAPAIGRGLKGFWGGLTGGGAKPGAATAETGAAGASAGVGPDGKPLPAGFGGATPQGMLGESQMMHGQTPQQMQTRERSNQAMMNRMNASRRAAEQSRQLYAL